MWLQTICLVPLFFVISTGFGLSILTLASTRLIRKSGLSRLEVLTVAFTIGAPGSGTFLQLLCLVQRNLDVDLAALSTLALVGLFATRDLWRPRAQDLREISIWLVIVAPLAAMTWWWSFGAISSFPFTDIGADVHWMKIAREFADTGVLNPFAGQTYLDLRAATAGLLSGTLGLDLLQFHWVYRYLSILCLGMFFYAAANSLFANFDRKWFAVFFAVSTNTLGLLTNGSLAVASSLVFLTALLRITAAPVPSSSLLSPATLVPAAVALSTAAVAFLLNNNTLLLAVLVTSLLVVNGVSRLRGCAGQTLGTLLVAATWSMSLLYIHRSGYLFIGIVVAGWFFYLWIMQVVSGRVSLPLKALWLASLTLPSLCLFILLYVALAHAGLVPKVGVNGLFSRLTELFLGRSFNEGDEIMLGAGQEVAAIEVGRAIGPSFVILASMLYLWWACKNLPARLVRLTSVPTHRAAILRLLWSWNLAFVLSLAALSGFPFMYRNLFIALWLFAVAITELFFQLFVDDLSASAVRLRRFSCSCLALITALTIGIYAFSWWPDLPYSTYQAMLRPALIGMLMFAALCTGLTFSGPRRTQIMAATAVISLSVAIDRSAILNLFRVYSYGRPPAGATVVSHYDASDLATARWLYENLPNSVVITDPTSLAMAKAMAGLPGLYLFSNLDTVNPLVADNIKEAISAVVHREHDGLQATIRACAIIAPMLAALNSEARVQMGTANLTSGILKAVRPGAEQTVPSIPSLPSEVREEEAADSTKAPSIDRKDEQIALHPREKESIERALHVLQTPHRAWNLVAIINPRTVQWLSLGPRLRLSYFPPDQPLQAGLLERLRRGPFPMLFSDGQNAVVSIPCGKLIPR